MEEEVIHHNQVSEVRGEVHCLQRVMNETPSQSIIGLLQINFNQNHPLAIFLSVHGMNYLLHNKKLKNYK